jgi:hypothetical protein
LRSRPVEFFRANNSALVSRPLCVAGEPPGHLQQYLRVLYKNRENVANLRTLAVYHSFSGRLFLSGAYLQFPLVKEKPTTWIAAWRMAAMRFEMD